MGEEENNNPIADLQRKFRYLRTRAEAKLHHADLVLDPRTKTALSIIDPIGLELVKYKDAREYTLPKILQLSAGETDYVSIRRLEGPQIQSMARRIDRQDGSITKATISYHFPTDLYQDNGIVVLAMPVSYGCRHKQEELEITDQLRDYEDADLGWIWDSMMSNRPDLYKPSDWTVDQNELIVSTMLGRTVFKTEMLDPNFYDLEKVNPEKDGTVILTQRGYFQSDQQYEAEMDFITKNAVAYVLMEGTNQSEKKPSRLSRLIPSPKQSRV